MTAMKCNEFLDQPDVAGFIKWIKDTLPKQEFHLRMTKSRFLPSRLNIKITGLPAVLDHYIWNASWNDADGTKKTSSDWTSTHTSMGLLRKWLRDAVSQKNEDAALAATLEILR